MYMYTCIYTYIHVIPTGVAVCHVTSATCAEGDVRLSVDGREPEDHELRDGELARGRVEVCSEGTFKPVCEDIDFTAASVVCGQLGFSYYGMYNVCRQHN